MKIKLLIICLFLISSHVFALTVTNTDVITYGNEHYYSIYITLDDIDSDATVRCVIYNDKKVAIGKGSGLIFGIGKVVVTIPATTKGKLSYSCNIQ